MAVEVSEMRLGRSTTKKQGERQYRIKGCTDEPTALAYLLAFAPAQIGLLKRKDSECKVEEIVTDIYVGTASYSSADKQPEQGSFSISFDITGQTTHLTQSIKTVAQSTARNRFGRDFKGAIGVNSDGTVEGCDILIPSMTFQVDYSAKPEDINDAYIQKLADIVGRTNKTAFKGFKECELLLTKVSGSKRDEDNWDLSFGFSVSRNKTGIKIGDCGPVNKKGWEYLWVYYALYVDDDTHTINKFPEQVRVEQVYESADYAGLGLP